jgi:endonuclease/exonuclease/phosphatase family metal-dependent hydrolase
VLSVANYNMHCGMDGWGRPYDYLDAIASLDADVIALEEAWTTEGDGSGGQAAEAARPTRRGQHLDRATELERRQPGALHRRRAPDAAERVSAGALAAG